MNASELVMLCFGVAVVVSVVLLVGLLSVVLKMRKSVSCNLLLELDFSGRRVYRCPKQDFEVTIDDREFRSESTLEYVVRDKLGCFDCPCYSSREQV